MILNVLKVFGLSAFTFFLAILLTPVFTRYLYKYKLWKKVPRSDFNNHVSDDFKKIHNAEGETNTPRIGGMIIWVCVLLTSVGMWAISKIFPSELSEKLNFLSKNQTWLPLFVLLSASVVGLIDDLLQTLSSVKSRFFSAGLPRRVRISVVILIGAIGAWWFFYKLGMSFIHIPFIGDINLGWMFIPLFIITMFVVFSGGVIDGIDGLAGGILASVFSAYAGIAFFQNQIDIATFCAVIAGGILAFLWFNIPPARFYMGETGMLGLTATLTAVAFLTRAAAVLPIIALPLFVASGSSFLQMVSKKYFGRRIFKVAPIHYHFKALGWPFYKITMRFWVIGIVCAITGMVIALIG